MKDWAAGSVPISDGHLAYHRTGGAGPPLVLSHGLTDNGLCWSRLASALESQFDIVMLDARGHGLSSRRTSNEPRDAGRDIAEAIEALGLASPIVMGHSVGARATAAYANAFPARVSKVILEDPNFIPIGDAAATENRRWKFRQQIERFQSMTEAEIEAMGRASSPSWRDDEFSAWAAAKRQVDPDAMPSYATPWQQEIDRLTVPTLIVHGQAHHGSLTNPAIAGEAIAINPNIRAVEIEGAGHNVRRDNFPDFLSAVRAFLRGEEPQAVDGVVAGMI